METLDINKIHTTELGLVRIARNIGISESEVVGWCKSKIADPLTKKERRGKNWYIEADNAVITVNASSLTVITAHRRQ